MLLFRQEALAAKHNKRVGPVVETVRWSTAIAVVSGALTVTVVLGVFWGQYTRTINVPGYLVPAKGLVRVFAPQPGIVVDKRVAPGTAVNKGDILYVISSDRDGAEQSQFYAKAADTLRERLLQVSETIETTRTIQAVELERVSTNLEKGRAQLALLDDQITVSEKTAALNQSIFERKSNLRTLGWVTLEQIEAVQISLFDLNSRLLGLRKDRELLQQQLAALELDVRQKPLLQQNEIMALKKERSSLVQQLAEMETRRENVVVAPDAGVFALDIVEVGQAVQSVQPLGVINPQNSKLLAHLFAPSRAVGFIKPNNTVKLQYDAFPYQKFGQYSGKILSIAKTALSPSEVTSLQLPASEQVAEPLYRIVVEIETQQVAAYGESYSLQAGMALHAYISQETRYLYEWILDPLYSIQGFGDGTGASRDK
jgi:membrane fusion protein